ncbi:alpha/beta hydrolase [Tardibacter chloracetimidivorans]|uniref:Alpha/beta hydrolase n=1 Tax=Tardibacter chloracetimidivorans TaxID=1921510 RepID=A0A1L3ZST6_9SPHN|nr:alpha/beta hydrolase [Tardibacter chloracetimidivorans]API58687.1 alpha/beta hydrolase [Tardibacter chloracetimidivorans]
MQDAFEVDSEWVSISYQESIAFTEVYGFAGNQGAVNLEGILFRPRGVASKTLQIYMHPASTLQLLPVPREAVRRGAHVLCAGSRYARNDTAAILEKVLLDLGAYIRHAKSVWGYEHIVLVGWSGGGSLSLFYQAQAERPTITHTPAGDPVDIVGADLIPADAVIFQAAHISRARLLLDIIDPSVRDELNPDDRDPDLDIYNIKPPFDPAFIKRYREAQLARVRRITGWVKDTLEELRRRGGAEVERGFVTHRTLADPRFLDPALDPNDRPPGWCYLGNPETVNSGPVGLARFSTLRAWLSQWSIDDTQGDGVACASVIRAPLLFIENSADDAVPQPHCREVFDAAVSPDKRYELMEGATHYYKGQPELLAKATDLTRAWLSERGLAGR